MDTSLVEKLINHDISPLQLLDKYDYNKVANVIREAFHHEKINIVYDEISRMYVSIGNYIPFHHMVVDEIVCKESRNKIFDGLVIGLDKMSFEIEEGEQNSKHIKYLNIIISSHVKLLAEIVKYIKEQIR